MISSFFLLSRARVIVARIRLLIVDPLRTIKFRQDHRSSLGYIRPSVQLYPICWRKSIRIQIPRSRVLAPLGTDIRANSTITDFYLINLLHQDSWPRHIEVSRRVLILDIPLYNQSNICREKTGKGTGVSDTLERLSDAQRDRNED